MSAACTIAERIRLPLRDGFRKVVDMKIFLMYQRIHLHPYMQYTAIVKYKLKISLLKISHGKYKAF